MSFFICVYSSICLVVGGLVIDEVLCVFAVFIAVFDRCLWDTSVWSATKFGHLVTVPDLARAILAEPRANRRGSLRRFRACALQPGPLLSGAGNDTNLQHRRLRPALRRALRCRREPRQRRHFCQEVGDGTRGQVSPGISQATPVPGFNR